MEIMTGCSWGIKKLIKNKDLFWAFFKIGLLTLGGGYAMIPVIQSAVVEEHKWLTEAQFLDALAVSQSAPGAIAINSSVYIGYRLKGVRGAIASALGTAMPSFLVILLISSFFFKFREFEYIEKIFKGVRAAVASMIAVSLIKLLKIADFGRGGYALFGFGAILLICFKLNPIWVLLTGGTVSILYFTWKGAKNR